MDDWSLLGKYFVSIVGIRDDKGGSSRVFIWLLNNPPAALVFRCCHFHLYIVLPFQRVTISEMPLIQLCLEDCACLLCLT